MIMMMDNVNLNWNWCKKKNGIMISNATPKLSSGNAYFKSEFWFAWILFFGRGVLLIGQMVATTGIRKR